MDHGTPVLTEQVTDEHGTYERQWYCPPPAPCVTFMVTDSSWTPDYSVRRVFAVSVGQGRDRR